MLSRFKRRSYELENIDRGTYSAEEYEGCILELQLVNRWLGDSRAIIDTLVNESGLTKLDEISVLDVGAGSGELLRVIDDWAGKTARRLHGVGVELNSRSATAILEQSKSRIDAVQADALKLPFRNDSFDYVICSLFTHHFVDEQVVKILEEMSRVARRKIIVIDLHRHPIAYLLYTTIGKLFLHNRLLREDGALSILRSFKSDELVALAEDAKLREISVARHFPFRLVLTAAAQSAVVYSEPRLKDKAA
jgi:ubiquinone/menaquinone biosynthesis C-methylase UbiE